MLPVKSSLKLQEKLTGGSVRRLAILCSLMLTTFTGWRKWVSNWVSASTGTPSDGLDGGTASEGSTTTGFMSAQRESANEKEEAEWVVDEIVVDGDDTEVHRHLGSDKGTGTGTRRTESQASDHGGGESHSIPPESYLTPGFQSWMRWRAWPMLYSFFDPRFDEPEREWEFQKLAWYTNKRFTL
jgi:hypothetical protein